MAIAGKRFWLGTWNCENQAPDPNTNLATFVTNPVNAAGANGPDIIFLGFQEVDTHMFEFPHERLAKAKGGRLGAQYTIPQGGSLSAKGMTKGTINNQALGMLVKTGANVTNIQSGYFTHRGGKGGLYLTFEYETKKFGVASAHLESKGQQHQDTEITEIFKKMTNGNISTLANFHAVFIMGDLNYRCVGNPNTGPSIQRVADPASGLQVHAYTAQNEVIPNTMRGEDLAATILSPVGRTNLLRGDQILQSPLVTAYHFTFPVPQSGGNNPSFPTYKREYKAKPAVGAFIANRNVRTAMTAYCLKEGPIETSPERGNAYDIGWLDRIGYKALAAPAHCTVEDCESVNLSDHTPVMMKYQF
jgi:endonuclease/exonuclease/phosphatase family metal-dependent hydrolase